MTFSHLGLVIIVAAVVLLPLWLYVECTGKRLVTRLVTGLALFVSTAGSVQVLMQVAGASRLHYYQEVLYRLGSMASGDMESSAVEELARYREAALRTGPEEAVKGSYERLAFQGKPTSRSTR